MPTRDLSIFCVIAFVAANVAFYILSIGYFDTHKTLTAADTGHIRLVFGVSSAIVTLVCFVVALSRRALGHALVAALGAINLVGCVAALAHHLPPVLVATLLLSGALMPILAWQSYRRSRAAWGFLAAICGTFAVVGLFGAPRLRDILNVSLWTVMLVPAFYVVATVTLYLLRDDYSNSGPVSA